MVAYTCARRYEGHRIDDGWDSEFGVPKGNRPLFVLQALWLSSAISTTIDVRRCHDILSVSTMPPQAINSTLQVKRLLGFGGLGLFPKGLYYLPPDSIGAIEVARNGPRRNRDTAMKMSAAVRIKQSDLRRHMDTIQSTRRRIFVRQ